MKRNRFNHNHTHLTTCDMGELIPIAVQEVLFGDTLNMSSDVLVRCAPMLTPVMHRVDCMIHHWYVPYRVIWSEFENFITGGPDGDSLPTFPTIAAPAVGGFPVGSLGDYARCAVGVNSFLTSALVFRAYAKVWNENYRDQDLQDPLPLSTASGPDSTTSTTLQYAPWEKDYFTTSRPWTQKGPEVTLPLTGNAPVLGIAGLNSNVYNQAGTGLQSDGSSASGSNWSNTITATSGQQFRIQGDNTSKVPAVYADLSDVTSATVNDLRLALALQRFEENRARYGSRYTEYLSAHGVKSSDSRLQRPEYLGGGKQVIQFSEVLQTAEGTDPVGTLRGHGIGNVRSNSFRKFFEEHGIVISLLSVKPKSIYMDGSPRMHNRRVKEDFWTKELEHIGQQEVLNKEVYAAHPTPNGTFGYQDRYDEYRRAESYITGEFRTTQDMWHFGRHFASPPALNASFVSGASITKEPFADQGSDVLQLMCNHRVTKKSLVSKRGNSFIL